MDTANVMRVTLEKHVVKFCVQKIVTIRVNVCRGQVVKVYIVNAKKVGKELVAASLNALINAMETVTVYTVHVIVMVTLLAQNAT
jgi:hypothetical protein